MTVRVLPCSAKNTMTYNLPVYKQNTGHENCDAEDNRDNYYGCNCHS